MEGTKFVFESKTIMKMELLVLSSLDWKMNPVTPLAFFDYIMRRLNLTTHNLHYEFLRRCERILLSVVNGSNLPNSISISRKFFHFFSTKVVNLSKFNKQCRCKISRVSSICNVRCYNVHC